MKGGESQMTFTFNPENERCTTPDELSLEDVNPEGLRSQPERVKLTGTVKRAVKRTMSKARAAFEARKAFYASGAGSRVINEGVMGRHHDD
jgi:hypothetical protein